MEHEILSQSQWLGIPGHGVDVQKVPGSDRGEPLSLHAPIFREGVRVNECEG